MSPALTKPRSPSPGKSALASNEPFSHVKSADEMDEERREHVAYEYLCRLEEAKKWIEALLHEELPEVTQFEQNIRNGVVLAKLAAAFAPNVVNERKIFDKDQARFEQNGLHFRHTDNINYFLKALASVGLPELFCPETTDIYDGKNIPRAIYCIHALSLYLFKLGKAPQMLDLLGKATFTAEQISAMRSALDEYGLPMPQFRRIGGILADELPVDEAAFHAAIMAINNALDANDSGVTLKSLQNPNACLNDVDSNPDAGRKYHLVLKASKEKKINNQPETCGDAYDQLLTQEEIQLHIEKINQLLILEQIEDCVKGFDLEGLNYALNSKYLAFDLPIRVSLLSKYLKEIERLMRTVEFLRKEDVENAIKQVNKLASSSNLREKAVQRVNAALGKRDVEALLNALKVRNGQNSRISSTKND